MSDQREFRFLVSLEPGLKVGLLSKVVWNELRPRSDGGLFFLIQSKSGKGRVSPDVWGWWLVWARGISGIVRELGQEFSGLVFAIDTSWVKQAGLSLEKLWEFEEQVLLPGLAGSLIRGIILKLEEKHRRKLIIKGMVFELLDLLFTDAGKSRNKHDWRVQRVKEILRERITYRLSLKELGREVGCSSYYLSRIFSQRTGQTLSEYMRRLRLERARELIELEGRNVTEAAYDVGYSSLSHFSREFARYFRRLPKSFKL